jgi:hypothetical protein
MQLMAGLGAMMMSGMGGANGMNPQSMMQRMQQMLQTQAPQLHIDVAQPRVGQGGMERAPMQRQLGDSASSSPEEERTRGLQLVAGGDDATHTGEEEGAEAPIDIVDDSAITMNRSMLSLKPPHLAKGAPADGGAVARAAVFEMERAHKAAVDASTVRVAAAKAAAKAAVKRKRGSKPPTSVPAGPSIMKRPSSAMATARTAGRPACPATGAAAVYYKGGNISQSDSKKGWRVWPDASDVRKENLVKYGPDRSSSWDEALTRLEKRPRS